MSAKKAYFVMLGILALLIGGVFGTVVIGDGLLKRQSAKLVELKVDEQVIDQQQAALTQAKQDIETYTELNDIAKQIVPQDKDQARATREIINIAADAGVHIASVSFPASTLGQKAKPAPKPAASENGEAAAAAPAKKTPTVTQVEEVDGMSGLYQLKITVTSDPNFPASYDQLVNFLKGLERNRRTAGVSEISIQPDAQNRSLLNFSLTVTEYIKP